VGSIDYRNTLHHTEHANTFQAMQGTTHALHTCTCWVVRPKRGAKGASQLAGRPATSHDCLHPDYHYKVTHRNRNVEQGKASSLPTTKQLTNNLTSSMHVATRVTWVYSKIKLCSIYDLTFSTCVTYSKTYCSTLLHMYVPYQYMLAYSSKPRT
jgi:hypothetical protein